MEIFKIEKEQSRSLETGFEAQFRVLSLWSTNGAISAL